MTYGIFMIIISYALANNPAITNALHVRDLETLQSICASKDVNGIIDINLIFSEYKKRTHLRVSSDTLYSYFRGLGVRFYGENC